MDRMLESIFPIGPRVAGAILDAWRTRDHRLSVRIAADTDLPRHATDDPLASYDAGIPGARLVSLDSGGHLQLGQTERVRDEIAAFLAS